MKPITKHVNIKNPCILYNTENNKCKGVYLYEQNKSLKDHYFGYKIVLNKITDFYILRTENTSLKTNTNNIVNKFPNYHCLEYNPKDNSILSKYKIAYNKITEEIKYNKDDIEVQRNYLCSYPYIPKNYIINKRINKDDITGYSIKNNIKYLLLKGIDYQIENI